MRPTRAFAFRLEAFTAEGHDLYLVIPDRGDAPPLERPSVRVGAGFAFVQDPAELIQIVDAERRGLACASAHPETRGMAICAGDPALEPDAATLGLDVVAPPPGATRTATVAALTAAWGQRAWVIAREEVFLHAIAAARAAGTAAAAPVPLDIQFDGASNNPSFAPYSTLIRGDLPSGELGFVLVTRACDVDAVREILVTRQYDDLVDHDLIHVVFRPAPAYAVRLLDHLQQCPLVPSFSRIGGGSYCAVSDADVATIACAVMVAAGPPTARLGSGEHAVSGRVLDAAAAAAITAGRAEPIRIQLAPPPPVPELTPDWIAYLGAAEAAAVGALPESYARLLALTRSHDEAIRRLAVEGCGAVMMHLSAADFDRIMAADDAAHPVDPEKAAAVAALVKLILDESPISRRPR